MRKVQSVSSVLRKAITVTGTGNDPVVVDIGNLLYPHGKIITKSEVDNTGADVTLDADATIALSGSLAGSNTVPMNTGGTNTPISHVWGAGVGTVFNNQAYDQITVTPANFTATNVWELVILLEGDF